MIELHNLNSEYEQSLDEHKSHSPKDSPKEHPKEKAKTPSEKRKNSPKDSPKEQRDPKDVTLTISKGVPPEKCDVTSCHIYLSFISIRRTLTK